MGPASYDLSQVLSSTARFRVLEALCAFGAPVPLRQLEALTGLAIRSVQVALAGLKQEGVVAASPRGRSVFWRLNSKYPGLALLQEVFALLSRRRIAARASAYGSGARVALRHSDETAALVGKARLAKRGRPAS